MQPCSREMQAINTLLNQQQQSQMSQLMPFDTTSLSSHDDYFEQMLSSINNPSSCSSWPDLSNPNPNPNLNTALRTAVIGAGAGGDDEAEENGVVRQFGFDDEEEDHQSSAFLASKLRHHQINNGGSDVSAAATAAAKALMLHQQLMLSRGLAGNGLRSPTGTSASGEHNLLPMPLGLGNDDQNDVVDGSSFKSANPANDSSVQALFNGFSGSLGQTTNPPQQFHHPQGGPMQAPNFGAPAAAVASQAAPPSGSTGAGAPTQPKQQRVRARRGQATDPHSIAERLRRERIAERMKSLQELVPNGNKTDKASMLDEIIDYVKFLQLQVKVLSMSRLGGAAAVAPLVADMSSEAVGEGGRTSGTQTTSPPTNDGMTVTEHQVAKLMEEDMGSAMQYLQGKGLCLMPISLATAISTATCHARNPMNFNKNNNTGGPTSPSVSVLTVANGVGEASVKDAASVSKS